jgi:hypothetical protein
MADRTGPKSLMDDKQSLIDRIMDYIENHTDYDDIVPSAEGLSYHLNVSRKTIYNWSDADDEILHTLDRLKTKQAKMLLSGGLSNSMNPTITKLMLSNHGYSEKIDNTSSDGSMSPKASNVVVTSSDVESIISKI